MLTAPKLLNSIGRDFSRNPINPYFLSLCSLDTEAVQSDFPFGWVLVYGSLIGVIDYIFLGRLKNFEVFLQ